MVNVNIYQLLIGNIVKAFKFHKMYHAKYSLLLDTIYRKVDIYK